MGLPVAAPVKQTGRRDFPARSAIDRPRRFDCGPALSFQDIRVMLQMIGHESLNEIIAVIVALLHAQLELLSRFRRGGRKFLRQQLSILQKMICGPLGYEDLWWKC